MTYSVQVRRFEEGADPLGWLYSLNEDEFAFWLKEALLKANLNPFPQYHHIGMATALVEIFDKLVSEHPDSQVKIINAIEKLLHEWELGGAAKDESLQELYDLFLLAAHYKCAANYVAKILYIDLNFKLRFKRGAHDISENKWKYVIDRGIRSLALIYKHNPALIPGRLPVFEIYSDDPDLKGICNSALSMMEQLTASTPIVAEEAGDLQGKSSIVLAHPPINSMVAFENNANEKKLEEKKQKSKMKGQQGSATD